MGERVVCPYIAHIIGEHCVFADKDCNSDCMYIEEEKSMGDKHEEFVRQVREAGESLIKNAESIVGNETYLSSMSIQIEICAHEPPEITVTKSFYPEKYVERIG